MRTEEPRVIRLSEYRPPDYRVADIALTFALDPKTTRVASRMTVECAATEASPLVLDGEGLTLVSVAIDGKQLAPTEFELTAATLTIPAPPPRFMLEIVTEIAPDANTALEGLYVAGGIFCTQCEAEGFRRMTYFLDRPDVLTVYTTRIEAEKARYPVLLSNGNLVESGELDGGRHYAVWHDPFPKPSYLFALVAGDLGMIRDTFRTTTGRDIDLRIYVEHGNEPKAAYAMDSLKRAMRWDEERYGREYDLDIFMIVAVSAFNFGAMENKGLNIFNDKLLLASPDTATDDDYARIESVVAHEYFHNWTGNRITCRDWFQLSLKEGLTVFRDQSFSEDTRSRAVKRIEDVRTLRQRQFQEDAGPLAHPVQPQAYITIDNFYTATVYEKGAEIIRMISVLLGEGGFRRGMDRYFAEQDGNAATVEDFVQAFEAATGRDLAQFRRWYAQAGTPTVEAHGEYDAETKRYTLTLRQSVPPTPGQPDKQPMHIPLTTGLLAPGGQPLHLTLEGENTPGPEERVLELTEAMQRFVFVDVPEPPVLSLGRHFSAPVRFVTPTSRKDRAFLMAHDTDAFNRWEAGQALATDLLLEAAARRPVVADVYVEAIGETLARADEDPAFAALMLTPPSESELAMAHAPADPVALHASRLVLIRMLAAAHGKTFARLYRELAPRGAYSPDAAQAGARALRNVCLRYLTAADDEAAAQIAEKHYRSAGNMTDMIAGLAALARTGSPRRDKAFADFHDRFRDNPLVLDKWMSLQAMSPLPDTIGRVRELMKEPTFSLKNPNRVRALIGAFAAGNHLRFHEANGAGYALVGETIRALDGVNPQTAARLATAFENWRRYGPERQAQMRSELETTAKMSGLSSNLYEVVTKMMG